MRYTLRQHEVIASAVEAVAVTAAPEAVVVVMMMEPAPGSGRGRSAHRSEAQSRNRGGGKNELTDHGGLSCLRGRIRYIPWPWVVRGGGEVHGGATILWV